MPPRRNSVPERNFGVWPQNRPGMGNQQFRRGPFPGRPPMQNPTGHQQKGVGGLISRILGNSKRQNHSPASYFSRPSAPVESGKSSGSLTTILANTQKVLSAAEQIGPMVQQYGPMIKNLPGMWKMYRGMKGTEEAEDETTEATAKESVEQVETETEVVINEGAPPQLDAQADQIIQKTKKSQRDSQPKLYI